MSPAANLKFSNAPDHKEGTQKNSAAKDPHVAKTSSEAVHPILGEYVDCLSASLIGIVPYPERARLKDETIDHLESLYEDLVARGESQDSAAQQAIEMYGSAEQIADYYSESYYRMAKGKSFVRSIGYGRCIAFSIFSVPVFATTILAQIRTYAPSNSVQTISVALSKLHHTIPNNAILPEWNWAQGLLVVITILSPILGGIIAGRMIPSKAGKAVVEVLPFLSIYSFIAGCLLLPMNEMLLCAIAQAIYWIPVAYFCTNASAAIKRIRSFSFPSGARRA